MRLVRPRPGRSLGLANILALTVLLMPVGVAAQDTTRLDVRVGGKDFRGTTVTAERFEGPKPASSGYPYGSLPRPDDPLPPSPPKTEGGRTVDFGGSSGRPLEPGIHNVTIRKDGDVLGATTYVFVGPGQSKTVEISQEGIPDEGINALIARAEQAKRLCQLRTYEEAMRKLRAWLSYAEAQERDMKRAIDEYLSSGLFDGLPGAERARLTDTMTKAMNAGYNEGGGMIRNTADSMRDAAGPTAADHLPRFASAYSVYLLIRDEVKLLRAAIEKLLPPPDCPKRTAMYRDMLQPIQVGAKDTVGCDAKRAQEIGSAFGMGGFGGFGGSRGVTFGGGGGMGMGDSGLGSMEAGSNGGDDLKTEPDPVKPEAKRTFTSPDGAVKLALGTAFADDGLWVSTNVLDAPCQGTFQTMFLQDPQTGKRAGPTKYRVTELYLDWKLTVSWTRDTYVNGQHVKHEEGGWSDSGSEMLGRWTTPGEGSGIWKDLGFGTAVAGVRGLAAYFPVSQAQFAEKPLDLVIHVTRPDQDPVLTIPVGWEGSFMASPKLAVGSQTGITGPLDGFGGFEHLSIPPKLGRGTGADITRPLDGFGGSASDRPFTWLVPIGN